MLFKMAGWVLLVSVVAAQLLMAAQAMQSSCMDVPGAAADAWVQMQTDLLPGQQLD